MNGMQVENLLKCTFDHLQRNFFIRPGTPAEKKILQQIMHDDADVEELRNVLKNNDVWKRTYGDLEDVTREDHGMDLKRRDNIISDHISFHI
mgnify:CR=1 FL=1